MESNIKRSSETEEVEGYEQFIGTFGNTVAVKKPTGVGGMRGTYMVSIAEGRAALGDWHPVLR